MALRQNGKSSGMNYAATASDLTRKMIAREMTGPNDTGPAMDRIERKFGIPFSTQEHLRRGKAKTVEAGMFARIRAAYLAHCERSIVALQHEFQIEKARGDDSNQDLAAEAEKLLAKIKERRQA